MEFTTGRFESYRAVTKVHLGAIETDLHPGDVVQFDGQTLKLGDKDHSVPTLRAAIKVGWLVPAAQSSGGYKPAPANIDVHKAAPTGEKREKLSSRVLVHDEEKDLGTLKQVRPPNAPPPHQAKNASQLSSENEGVVIAKIKSPTHFASVEVGKDDQTIVNQLDNKATLSIEKVASRARPTGDVDEALAGDDLEDILPNAASSSTPTPGPVVEEAEVTPSAIVQAKIEMIQQFVPGFTWDLKENWMTRAKKAEAFKDNPPVLNAILSFEHEVVRKRVLQRLGR